MGCFAAPPVPSCSKDGEHYPPDNLCLIVDKEVGFPNTYMYPLDSDLFGGQSYPCFEQSLDRRLNFELLFVLLFVFCFPTSASRPHHRFPEKRRVVDR